MTADVGLARARLDRVAYDQAAAAFVDVVARIAPERWDDPALGEWTVRELVGHCGRAFSTVVRFVDNPAEHVEVEDVGSYVRAAVTIPDIHAGVAERGREAGAALGADPLATVTAWRAEADRALAGCSGTEIGVTATGAMQLGQYLRTRVVELVVHTIDLCDALGFAVPDSVAAGRVALESIVGVPVDGERQAMVLRALMGRDTLPDGFNLFG